MKFHKIFFLIALFWSLSSARIMTFSIGEYAPYTGEELDGYGAFTEIVSAVLEHIGIQPRYEFGSWNRAYHIVKHHKAMGSFPYTKTPEREKEMLFSDPIYRENGKFFYKPSNHKETLPDNWTVDQLKSYKIGAPLGYASIEHMEALGLNPMIQKTEREMLLAIEYGHVDFVATGETSGWHFIQEKYGKRSHLFATLEKPFSEDILHVMVAKNHPEAKNFLSEFNTGLKKIKENGTYRKILEKHEMKYE